MKVLVTGGTGVIGRACVTELLRRGHHVRLLSRGADEDVRWWHDAVEPHPGDIGEPADVIDAADGCDAVLHIAGIVDEDPPDLTFERINIGGTRHVIVAAERADVARFVFVSSLGADRGESEYHRSKRAAEDIVRTYRGDWTIARLGAVVGPRDGTVSVLLRMVRSLPVVPVVGSGDQPYQPVWHKDAAWALVECLERTDMRCAIVPIAGPDTITVRETLDIFTTVTDRSPLRLPLPAFLVRAGTTFADAIGLDPPVSPATIQMLLEGSYVHDGETLDVFERFGHNVEPIRARLVELADAQPEQTPDRGVGKLRRRRFRIDIEPSRFRAAGVLQRFRNRFAELVPFEAVAEPGAPGSIEDGATLTLELPIRGHVQVRVERIDERSITLATIAGHPLAGIVHFAFDDVGAGVRFTIDVIDRPASRFDQIAMKLVGAQAQKRAWIQTARRVAEDAGMTGDIDVSEASWDLDDEAAEPLEEWIRELIRQRERQDSPI